MNPTLGKLDEEEIAPRFDWGWLIDACIVLAAVGTFGAIVYGLLRLAELPL